MVSLTITRQRLVRDAAGSRLRLHVHLSERRDLRGDEIDALFERFRLPEGARCSIRRGRLHRKLIRVRARFDTKL